MKKWKFSKRIAAFLLAMSMMLNLMPSVSMAAEVGDIENVSTGLTGDIDKNDTISLPVQILDYESDGMLFEFAEAAAGKTGVVAAKTASDFGATWYEDYTIRTSVGGSINTGNYWSDVNLALKTGTYANYTRMTWAGNTTANWTGNRAGVVMADFSESSTYITDQVRYMVVVFRSNVRSGNFTVGLNRANLNGAGTDGNYTGNIAVTTENDTNWTYAVLDLKTGTLGSNWSKGAVYGVYVGLPIDASGEWMDLAHVAFFSNKDQATAFGEYALTDGSDRGDNRAFGLLRGSRNQEGTVDFTGIDDEIDESVQMLNTYGTSATVKDLSDISGLGYKLLGTFGLKGIANIGLLESKLSSEGYPVYKKEVVDYVASLLKDALEITERTSDGWKNYRYVKGTASNIYGGTDLATALRTKINGKMGTYAEASGKDLIGTWAEVAGNIASYYDAAYFLLNSIFVPGSYNELQEDYDYLVLSAGTDSETSEKVYVFDGGFANTVSPSGNTGEIAIEYNGTEHTIQNTSAAGKAHFYYESGNTTTLHPFLPIRDRNTEDGMTKSPYYQDDGVINGVKKVVEKDTLYQRNFNFAMVSEGEFVYHADDELFFEFEGDDDVYLFINGELVMDIGSAHSIDIVRFELNDYVNAAKAGTLGSAERNAALALEEGGTYEFKFYYMERHSYGSNIRVVTNIHVTDPSMVTTKTAWQSETQLDFGSIVDKDNVVEYGFSITNNGKENLYNLTFTDNDIGVKLDATNGLTVTGERVYDVNGGKLEASDLTAVVSHPNYDDITVIFADNNALKAFLASLSSDAVVENGGGLWEESTVLIRGIGYKLSDAQVAAGVFDNTVLTTSTNQTESKTLQGQATMRVFVPADPMYYEWAGHDLKVSVTKLVEDVLEAAKQEGNILAGKVPSLSTNNVNKIELVTKAGNAISSPYVTIADNNDIIINYPTAGSKVFYVKITYNSSKNNVIVPVLVNVTDVKESIYVLDYGLDVVLTDNMAHLIKEDSITVPGRATRYGIMAITGEDPSYSPNNITFKAAASVEGIYGDFAYNEGKITYSPEKFMDGLDKIHLAMNVYESDYTPSDLGTVDINNEVQMYKYIGIVPANVVYYEDDFPAITYNNAGSNVFEAVGSSDGLNQDSNQNNNYGSDSVYADAENDEYSGNSLTKITINSAEVTASFTFKGTGFELIGRTNAKDAATLSIEVVNSKGEIIKTIPVINEFDNGGDGGSEEIHQIPVIRVKDLALGTYTVKISGVPAYDWDSWDGSLDKNNKPVNIDIIPTVLYVDGLRIFQPMGAGNENYNDTEKNATFSEIRDMIVDGYVGVAKYTGEGKDVGVVTYTGNNSWTENRNGEDHEEVIYEGNQVASVDQYLTMGPNNEVYMNGDLEEQALIFYVQESGSGVHNLQIAVRAIDPAQFYAGAKSEGWNSLIQYGTVKDGEFGWTTVATVESGTEQYYTIDYTKCPEVSDGIYQVAIRANTGMASFSSLKYNGLTINQMADSEATLKYENGILVDLETGENVDAANYMAFNMVSRQMRSTAVFAMEDLEETPELPGDGVEIPEVQEPAEDADNIPNQNDYTSRAEFIKKLIEFLKKFWGR